MKTQHSQNKNKCINKKKHDLNPSLQHSFSTNKSHLYNRIYDRQNVVTYSILINIIIIIIIIKELEKFFKNTIYTICLLMCTQPSA